MGMDSCVGKEFVDFHQPLKLLGKVECYLEDVIHTMVESLKYISNQSYAKFFKMEKNDWLRMDPSQVSLLINLSIWVKNVEEGLTNISKDKNAMKKAK
jgi:dynein heavy chain